MNFFLRQFYPDVTLKKLAEAIGVDLPKPYRVLHLASGNLFGGIEKILTTLAKYQSHLPDMHQGFGVCFHGRLRTELLDAGAIVHDIGAFKYSRPWSITPVQKRLKEIIKSCKYDVVIFYNSWQYIALAGTAKRADCRCIFWAMNYFGRGWLDWLATWSKPHIALACSRDVEQTVQSFSLTGTHKTIYPPHAFSDLPNPVSSKIKLRSQFQILKDTKIILMASRLDPYKGHRLLIEALGKLVGRMPEGWELWMAGGVQRLEERAYLESLQELAIKLGVSDKIRWLGQRADILELMAAADIFCHPNQGPEPFGVVFLEAQSMGCPIITSAIGGALESVEDNGKNTLLVDACPENIAEALEKHLYVPSRYPLS